MLKQPDIIRLLSSFGFSNLSLVKHESDVSTYRFGHLDTAKLRSLGEPSLASGGKVAIFEIPQVAKIGVCDSNSLVRFVDYSQTHETFTVHLGNLKFPTSLSLAFLKASGNTALQVPFCKKAWAYFNKTYFGNNLDLPVIKVSDTPPGKVSKASRAAHFPGGNFKTHFLWFASFLFNSREPFFIEIFLHEMCHQAALEISHNADSSEGGHGPVWQKWMIDVGLDPRRFDPTENFEYSTLNTKHLQEEADLSKKYGPRPTKLVLDKLKKTRPILDSPVMYVYKGRLFTGKMVTSLRFAGQNYLDSQYKVDLNFKTTSIFKSETFFEVF